MTAVFITATGTDIGKTFLTAGLIRHLRARGRSVDALKPVVSGFDPAAPSDPGILLAALGRSPDMAEFDRISPWRFAAPLSPDMAAERENRTIDFDELVTFCRNAAACQNDLLIEGVGGIMVPLDKRHTTLDWMAALHLPLLLVAGSYLGAISHTLSAVDVIKQRNLSLRAIIINESAGSTVSLQDTARTISRFVEPIEVITLPRLAGSEPEHPSFAKLIDLL